MRTIGNTMGLDHILEYFLGGWAVSPWTTIGASTPTLPQMLARFYAKAYSRPNQLDILGENSSSTMPQKGRGENTYCKPRTRCRHETSSTQPGSSGEASANAE